MDADHLCTPAIAQMHHQLGQGLGSMVVAASALGPPRSLPSRLPLQLGHKAPGATGTGSRGRTELQLHQEGKCSRSWP